MFKLSIRCKQGLYQRLQNEAGLLIIVMPKVPLHLVPESIIELYLNEPAIIISFVSIQAESQYLWVAVSFSSRALLILAKSSKSKKSSAQNSVEDLQCQVSSLDKVMSY